ncbi:hypothetical protein Pelo_2635 [Pelomyxa schiedti]|nr:hypothetical protein Pelo_2635 [Pelomyxa schiedti]
MMQFDCRSCRNGSFVAIVTMSARAWAVLFGVVTFSFCTCGSQMTLEELQTALQSEISLTKNLSSIAKAQVETARIAREHALQASTNAESVLNAAHEILQTAQKQAAEIIKSAHENATKIVSKAVLQEPQMCNIVLEVKECTQIQLQYAVIGIFGGLCLSWAYYSCLNIIGMHNKP